jgi:uncharacterized Zn-finger protein
MKEYICNLCDFKFSTKSNLNRHLNRDDICIDTKLIHSKIENLKKEINLLKNPNYIEEKTIKQSNCYKYKKYTMPSGKIINYQGYENIALDELLILFNENDIENERYIVPTIQYTKNNKEYNYYPDIFIKSKNLIIEVKSDWTYKAQLIENILKALAVRKAGYNFEFWIYTKKLNKIII